MIRFAADENFLTTVVPSTMSLPATLRVAGVNLVTVGATRTTLPGPDPGMVAVPCCRPMVRREHVASDVTVAVSECLPPAPSSRSTWAAAS